MVPVVINGKLKKLVLTTAAGISILSKAAVSDLGLRTSGTDGRVKLLSRNGEASASYVTSSTFGIGGLQGKNVSFMVSASSQMGTSPGLPIDGALALDLLGAYDIELDFASHKLNLFRTDHCEGKVVYWPAQIIAVVPYVSTRPGSAIPTHISVPVTLDGKRLSALIDTAATRSTMSEATARYTFEVTADSPGAVPLGNVDNDPNHKIFGHVFGGLTFEGVTVRNPHIVVLPDLVGSKDPYNDRKTGSNIKRADDDATPALILGMDVLRNMRLYIATRERRLYITPVDAPAGATGEPASSP
jgi:hypothetical protein